MRVRRRARPSEIQAMPCSKKDLLLLSTSSSRDSDAPLLPRKSRHLPAGLAHMHTAGIASDTRVSWQDPPGSFYPGLTHIPKRSQWLQRVGRLLAELRAAEFPVSVAGAVTSSLLPFTLPFLQLLQTRAQKGQRFTGGAQSPSGKGTGNKKHQGLEESQAQRRSGCPEVKHT